MSPVLAAGVITHVLRTEDSGGGGGVDDAAIPLFAHHLPRRESDVKGALQMDIKQRFHPLHGQLVER